MPKEEKPNPAGAPSGPNRSSSSHFDLSSFAVDSAALEIRFPMALTIWDRVGHLWRAIQEKWPEITPISSEPNRTDFRAGKTRLTVELEAARIGTIDPERSLEEFSKESRDFVRLITQHLQITTYKRVGFRLVYFKEFRS